MKNVFRFVLSVAASLWLVSVLVTADSSRPAPLQQQAPPPPPQLANPDDPGAGLLATMCFKCHDATRILATRKTRMEWEDTINKMIERGATGSGKEFETVFVYLVANYGKVYINDASADDIVKIVGLSRKDADAIVAFRTANGAFADVEALKKVPEIDLKALEANIKAIAF